MMGESTRRGHTLVNCPPTRRDSFCWKCHLPETSTKKTDSEFNWIYCPSSSCQRVFHPRCWPSGPEEVCDACRSAADALDFNKFLTKEEFNRLLVAFIDIRRKDVRRNDSSHDKRQHQKQHKESVYPMDLETIEEKSRSLLYTSTKDALNDFKWNLHNEAVNFGPKHTQTVLAKKTLDFFESELKYMPNCVDCVLNHYQYDNGFCRPCRRPHALVWAALPGYPYWPAKVLSVEEDGKMVNISFFEKNGKNSRKTVPIASCLSLTKRYKESWSRKKSSRTSDLTKSLDSLKTHLNHLEVEFGYKLGLPKEPEQFKPQNLYIQQYTDRIEMIRNKLKRKKRREAQKDEKVAETGDEKNGEEEEEEEQMEKTKKRVKLDKIFFPRDQAIAEKDTMFQPQVLLENIEDMIREMERHGERTQIELLSLNDSDSDDDRGVKWTETEKKKETNLQEEANAEAVDHWFPLDVGKPDETSGGGTRLEPDFDDNESLDSNDSFVSHLLHQPIDEDLLPPPDSTTMFWPSVHSDKQKTCDIHPNKENPAADAIDVKPKINLLPETGEEAEAADDDRILTEEEIRRKTWCSFCLKKEIRKGMHCCYSVSGSVIAYCSYNCENTDWVQGHRLKCLNNRREHVIEDEDSNESTS